MELEAAKAVLPFVRTPAGGSSFLFGGIVHGVDVKGKAYGCWETRCCGGRDGLAESIPSRSVGMISREANLEHSPSTHPRLYGFCYLIS